MRRSPDVAHRHIRLLRETRAHAGPHAEKVNGFFGPSAPTSANEPRRSAQARQRKSNRGPVDMDVRPLEAFDETIKETVQAVRETRRAPDPDTEMPLPSEPRTFFLGCLVALATLAALY